MLFNHRRFHFDIPYQKIREQVIHHAYSNIGALKDEDGSIAPCGSYGTSINRKLAIKKAFSESLERRALMIGGYQRRVDLVETWDFESEKLLNFRACLPYQNKNKAFFSINS